MVEVSRFQATSTEVLATSTEELAVGTEELAVGTEGLAVDTEELAVDTEELAVGIKEHYRHLGIHRCHRLVEAHQLMGHLDCKVRALAHTVVEHRQHQLVGQCPSCYSRQARATASLT